MPIRVIGLVSLIALCSIIIQSPSVSSYIDNVKKQETISVLTPLEEEKREQVKKIEQLAKSKEIAPIDARIDPIWKAIPGYNGRRVDIQKTIKKTINTKRTDQIQWVYQSVPPKLTLSDLKPAPIYKGNPAKPAVGIMINVAWGTEYIQPMLQIMQEHQVKATFFLDGSWLKKHPSVAKKIVKKGHEIGNHAYSHPAMSQIPKEKKKEEIERTEALIQQFLQVKSSWFAPPGGDYDQEVVEIAESMHMKTVLWTADTIDWRKGTSPSQMIERIGKDLGNGTLILMHPTDRTVIALPRIIHMVKEKGLQPTTVKQTLSSERMKE